ncbi:helix-turn-helix domain-containing protein [Paenibacillus sp. YN15]|uniref:helix-turn-helix domain-containing protein n=1 Tax=Paenibacillus sp. YN15 TaxID=1742774 RepID=UPI000DCB4921|nr:AraC family transcriptional regulator [Paenibacillus sp. YN15]RAU95719.1 hypothetical protein DQG13_21675 [Paenibacillus sp. YN15]
MKIQHLWNLVPVLHLHAYFRKKNQFFLDEDIYSDWAIFIPEEGVFRYEMNDAADTVSPGEMIICPPDTTLKRKTVVPLTFHFIRCHWLPSNLSHNDLRNKIPTGKINISNHKRMLSTLTSLRKASSYPEPFQSELKNHLLRDIWFLYCTEIDSSISRTNAAAEDPLLEEALEYIHLNAFNKLNVKELSRKLGLTHAQFIRRFKAELGKTPVEYITFLRLEKAKELLVDTTSTLAQVASRCGYSNEYYFSNVFKHHVGMPPSRYRLLYRI